MHFDRAFIGMNGVDDGYYTTPDMEEGAVKRAILENAKQTYVLVDSSKIGQTCFAKVAPLKRANCYHKSRGMSSCRLLRRKRR